MDRGNNVRPLALSLTVLGAVARLLPHPPNFAPVGGMSLYAGARLRGWQAFAVPLLLMAVTDPLRGGYSIATPFIYLSFMISVWIGRRLQATESPLRIGASPDHVCGYMFPTKVPKLEMRKNCALHTRQAAPMRSGLSVACKRRPIHTLIMKLR